MNVSDGFDGKNSSELEKEQSMDQEGVPEKACITVLNACTVHRGGNLESVSYKEGQIIPAQFNPTEYSIRISTKYEPEKGGISQDSDTFGNFRPPEPARLSVKLIYDSVIQMDYLDKMKGMAEYGIKTLDSMTINLEGFRGASKDFLNAYSKYDDKDDLNSSYIESILNLARLTSETGRPPLISFLYGSTNFVGYLESVDVNFKRFNKLGEVIRAEISIDINEAMEGINASNEMSIGKSNILGLSSNDITENEPLGLSDLFSSGF